MQFIDTHTHLYSDQFKEDRDDMISKALGDNVYKMFMPNVDSKSIEGMLALETAYPGQCIPMMGLHPCSVKPESYKEELSLVREWLDKRPFVAIGEIGIDLHWDKSTLDIQKEAFITQVEWALEFDLPIVIHARESIDILIELVEPYIGKGLKGVFHCFTGDVIQAKKIIELGFYLGIGGVITFKNSGLDKVVAELPISSLVLETDAPYLAPHPNRGKRNESSFTTLVADKLANIYNVPVEEVARVTTKNALSLYRQQIS